MGLEMKLELVIAFASLSTCMALAGPDWTEVGDAGGTIESAQVPLGNGEIHSLSGRLGTRGVNPDYEDMYFIGIAEPTSFVLEINNTDFDAQLFIFHVTLAGGALGLLANDDRDVESLNPRLVSASTDGTEVFIDLPGDYLVAVAGKGRNPVSVSGLIFNIEDPTEISGADGPGGLMRHTGWEGQGQTGSYRVDMEGTVFPAVPAPASAVALLAVGLTGRRKR